MTDPLKDNCYYRYIHALFMMSWWSGEVWPGVADPARAQAALSEAIGWAGR